MIPNKNAELRSSLKEAKTKKQKNRRTDATEIRVNDAMEQFEVLFQNAETEIFRDRKEMKGLQGSMGSKLVGAGCKETSNLPSLDCREKCVLRRQASST